MTDENPGVDVIIPVHNGARYLGEAIQSVLRQTYTAIDVIVVDDGSEDRSAAVAAQIPGVRVLRQPHHGIGVALNLAIRHANGPLLAFLDADDRWLPDKLERQVGALMADPTLDMVFGHVHQFYQPDGSHGGKTIAGATQPGVSRNTLLVWRTAFARVGGFVETRTVHSFLDWYARACDADLRTLILPVVVAERRVHDENLGLRTPDAQRQSYLQALRIAVTRRRPQDAADA